MLLHSERLKGFVVPLCYMLMAAGLVAYATSGPWGIARSYDSLGYINSANEILSQGLLVLGEKTMIEQPPLYPLFLSLGAAVFDCSMLGWARALNMLFAAFTIFLVWRIAERNFVSKIYAHMALWACLFSVSLLNVVWIHVWTEAPFIVLCLVVLSLCAKSALNGKELILCGVSITAACATRYAGVVLLPIAAMASVRSLGRGKLRIDWERLLATVFAPSLCFALYAVRNWLVSGTFLGPRHPSSETLWSNMNYLNVSVQEWFGMATFVKSRFIFRIADLFPNVPVFTIVLTASVVVLCVIRWRMHYGDERRLSREIVFHMLFVFVYVAFIVATSTTTAYDRIGPRLMAPALPSAMVVFFYLLPGAGVWFSERRAKALCVGLVTISILGLALAVIKSLPGTYLLTTGTTALSATLFFFLTQRGYVKTADVILLFVLAPVVLLSCQTLNMSTDIRENGRGLHSAYYIETEMTEYLQRLSADGRTIFCEEDRYAADPGLNVKVLPRSKYYRSNAETGITAKNALDRYPELDGALLVLRNGVIPDGFVDLFSDEFPGKADSLKCFRTGCVWEIHARWADADDGAT